MVAEQTLLGLARPFGARHWVWLLLEIMFMLLAGLQLPASPPPPPLPALSPRSSGRFPWSFSTLLEPALLRFQKDGWVRQELGICEGRGGMGERRLGARDRGGAGHSRSVCPEGQSHSQPWPWSRSFAVRVPGHHSPIRMSPRPRPILPDAFRTAGGCVNGWRTGTQRVLSPLLGEFLSCECRVHVCSFFYVPRVKGGKHIHSLIPPSTWPTAPRLVGIH